MKSISNLLTTLYQQLNLIEGLNCFHYEESGDNAVPYLVWAERGEGDSFCSSNHKQEQVITGVCDFYTATEFDPLVDDIQTALDEICAWKLQSVAYEDETKLIHYSWEWELV